MEKIVRKRLYKLAEPEARFRVKIWEEEPE
jgi:hypothetical protein